MNIPADQSILSEKTFRGAKDARGKADIFSGVRDCSWADFNVLPMPNRRMEEWRFASISRVDFDGFSLPKPVPGELSAELSSRSNRIPDAAGTLVFADDNPVRADLDPALAAQGVILAPLKALSPAQRLAVREYFFVSCGGICSEKISTLHRAYSEGGAYLLYVPAGVKIDRPFAVYHWAVSEQGATFPYALVIAEENASAAFVNFFLSAKKAEEKARKSVPAKTLTISRLEIFAKSGAQVARKLVQDMSADAHFYQQEWTHVRENATVRGIALNLGAQRARTTTELRLEGQGARADLFSLTVADGEQEIDQRTMQRHIAPDAVSNLLFKNVLLDRSRTIFGGSIVVAPAAQQTSAIQSNRNLILSPEAESHSLPGLEIDANDVACSHGATNGTLDADQLFYLRQRGIPEDEARALLIQGFFEEVIGKIESSALAGVLRESLIAKF